MQVYLARPIDKTSDATVKYMQLVRELADSPRLHTRSISFYAPGLAFVLAGSLDHSTSHDLMLSNLDVLAHSDVLVIEYVPGIESWGVPQEALIVSMTDVPILVLSPVMYTELPVCLKALVDAEHVVQNIDMLAGCLDVLELRMREET